MLGLALTAVVGTVAGIVGVRTVGVRGTVGLGVRGVGIVVGDITGVAVRVAVRARVGVAVGLTAAQPKSGVRQTPGVVPGVGKLQSALTAQEKSEKSPPSQKRPVEAQAPPGQWAARKQPNPRKSPAVHTFCVPTHARPVPQVPSPAAVRHGSPANAPPWQVPSVPVPTHVPPGQSHGKPSKSPPSQTPWMTTQAPKELGQETKQSSSDWQVTPSRGPPLQARSLVTCARPTCPHTIPSPTRNTAIPFFTFSSPRSRLHSPCARFSQLENQTSTS